MFRSQLLKGVSAVGCHYVSIACCSMPSVSYGSVFAFGLKVLWLQARELQVATALNYE